MKLSGGELFAGYSIVRPLGAGAMGEVYLAQHPRLPRREALKILKADISNDESFRQRFIREADSIAALEHPNIVTVHDRGDNEDRLWIATQYVDGADAAQLMRDRYPGGMPADEVVEITTAIAAALDYAHSNGLLHRDVKPANILMAHPDQDGNRRIYLADFGIARPLDDPTGLTATNFTLGTVAYAAPEQLMGKAIDGRADQYALAATAYHLLTGRPVYSDSNPVAVISAHLAEPPPPPSTVRAELAPFDAAFARALAKQPQDRFARCQDFAHALASAAGPAGYSPSAPTQEAPVPPPNNETPLNFKELFAQDPRMESVLGELLGRSSTTAVEKATRERRNTRLMAAGAAIVAIGIAGALMWHPWTKSIQPQAAPTPSQLPTTTATPSTSSPAAAARPTYPPAGALGSACPPPGGAIGTGPDGAIYYCARVEYTDGYEWSLTQGTIPNPSYTPSPVVNLASVCSEIDAIMMGTPDAQPALTARQLESIKARITTPEAQMVENVATAYRAIAANPFDTNAQTNLSTSAHALGAGCESATTAPGHN